MSFFSGRLWMARPSRSRFFFNDTATTEIYTLSLHDALPILARPPTTGRPPRASASEMCRSRSEEHTSELQSLRHLVCRLLLEKKNTRRHTLARQSGRGWPGPLGRQRSDG